MQLEQNIPSFESGSILLSTGDLQVLAVNLTSTQINVNIEDKAFIKRIIAMRDEIIPKSAKPEDENIPPNIGGALSILRSVAETLRNRGVTLIVSYQNHPIVTIGANANPTLLHHITKTRGVSINSLYTVIKILI